MAYAMFLAAAVVEMSLVMLTMAQPSLTTARDNITAAQPYQLPSTTVNGIAIMRAAGRLHSADLNRDRHGLPEETVAFPPLLLPTSVRARIIPLVYGYIRPTQNHTRWS